MSKNANVQAILSSLTSDAQDVLRNHFRDEFLQAVQTQFSTPKTKKPVAVGRRIGSADGRSASQIIRDIDAEFPGISAKDLVQKAKERGVNIQPTLVYQVRRNLRLKEDEQPEETETVTEETEETPETPEAEATLVRLEPRKPGRPKKS